MPPRETSKNPLLTLLDYYHQSLLLLGGGLLAFAWSRIFSLTSAANFKRSVILLALLSLLGLVLDRKSPATPDERRCRGLVAGLWIGLCLFYLALAIWNQLYLGHIVATGYDGDVFRNAFRTLQAPLYGVPAPITLAGLLTMMATVALYAVVSVSLYKHKTEHWGVLSALFMGLHLVAITAIGLATSPARVFDFSVLYAGIGEDINLGKFHSLPEVWTRWNDQLATLQGRARHYPPGVLFAAMVERRFDLPGLLGYASLGLTLLCVPLTLVQCRLMDLGRSTTLIALALLTSSTGLLVFPRVDFCPITAFLTLASLNCVTLAMQRRAVYGMASGLALGLCGLLTFTVAISGLVLALFLLFMLAQRALSLGKAVAIAAWVLAGLLAVWYGIYLASGFDILQCLVLSISHNAAGMTATPLDTMSRYGLRSTGNLLAYLASLGPLTALLAVGGLFRARGQGPSMLAFAAATLGTLLVASFSTLFFLETERIWVFFTPLMAIVGACGLVGTSSIDRIKALAAWVPVAVLIGSSLQVLGMTRDMPPDQHIEAGAWEKARALLRP